MLLEHDVDNLLEARRARRRRRRHAIAWLALVVGLMMIVMALAGRAS